MHEATKPHPYDDAELEIVRKNIPSLSSRHFDPEGCVRNYGRLLATIDHLSEQLSTWKKSYYDVADAVAADSASPSDLAAKARETRRERDALLRSIRSTATLSGDYTSAAAMARNELTEEEAYFLLRFAGHYGYERTIRRFDPWWRRLRTWVVWFGGWECPELLQWDEGRPAFQVKGDPYPLSLFGHLVTFYGGWLQLRWFGGWVVVSWKERIYAYWSPDGTPGHVRAKDLIGSCVRIHR